MMDMLTEPEVISILFDRIMELRIEQMKLMTDAGIDVLMLGDDVGMQTGMLIGAETWQEFLKPQVGPDHTRRQSTSGRSCLLFTSPGGIRGRLSLILN